MHAFKNTFLFFCLSFYCLTSHSETQPPNITDDVQTVVTTVDALIAASKNPATHQIIIQGNLKQVPTLRLEPEQKLSGENNRATLNFIPGSDGLQLTSNNQVSTITLKASPDKRAIFNDTQVNTLGNILLENVTTTGQVQILARDKITAGDVEVNGLQIIAADTRSQVDRPKGFGVDVTQGAFTLWNMQADKKIVLHADLKNISVGQKSTPVIGSGIFVSGGGFNGGQLNVSHLETGNVYSDGKIPAGTANQITGGVFTVYGTNVDEVHNSGEVVTYGVNDMALDNWGTVDQWIAEKKITSRGPSGIGFVNFGTINKLSVKAPIETFGLGARGFNVYDGTVTLAEFDKIITHGDGAVGIQISQPIGKLVVTNGIETFGGTGNSLVKGIITTLSAVGLSIKSSGSANEIEIAGGITTHAKNIAPLELLGTIKNSMRIEGGIKAAG